MSCQSVGQSGTVRESGKSASHFSGNFKRLCSVCDVRDYVCRTLETKANVATVSTTDGFSFVWIVACATLCQGRTDFKFDDNMMLRDTSD